MILYCYHTVLDIHYRTWLILIFVLYTQNLIALNLWGNKLQNADIVMQEITKCKNLKALWLNENPVLDSWYG
jgi:hypothetical protein